MLACAAMFFYDVIGSQLSLHGSGSRPSDNMRQVCSPSDTVNGILSSWDMTLQVLVILTSVDQNPDPPKNRSLILPYVGWGEECKLKVVVVWVTVHFKFSCTLYILQVFGVM